MSRTVLRRVERLEAARPQPARRSHFVFIYDDDDPEPGKAALIAAGEANEGDDFIVIEFVTPKHSVE